ncbi:hypothetical protein [Geitlerinema sp. P-1104]|uniref:hypothetical protein n=1 Tax=Geitlerinema sp. P-1104 TaxID=2546230 RepID=UPI00197E0CB4|nr:hypothetical protein [Geitlerinema sp. P-1104]
MTLRLCALILLLFLATACGGSPSTTSDSATSPASEQNASDPAVAKEKFEARIQKDLEKITPKLQEEQRQGNSVYRAESTGTYSYDIQQTNSIVSPFLGIAEYDIRWYANNEYVTDMVVKAQYAYQDGEWTLKEALRVNDGEAINDPSAVGNPAWAASLFQ